MNLMSTASCKYINAVTTRRISNAQNTFLMLNVKLSPPSRIAGVAESEEAEGMPPPPPIPQQEIEEML